MLKNLKCADCGSEFSANTKNVNECGMVFDIQCPKCHSWEVDIHNDTVEQILE